MTDVQSTVIKTINYSRATKTLTVCLHNDTTYAYAGVSRRMRDRFVNAESVGAFFNQVIKRRYTGSKVENDHAVVEQGEQQKPFLVYGTLRTGQGNWHRLLRGKTVSETPAIAPNQKMYSQGFAFVTDAAEGENYQVVGELMVVAPDHYDEVLAALDRLEGYNPQRPEHSMYVRVVRPVVIQTDDGEQTVEVWIYHGNPERMRQMPERLLVADGDWLRHTGGGRGARS